MADTFHDRRERIFMNKQVIISIGREYGSGGHVIAEIIAKHYNIPLYDRNILDELSKETGNSYDVYKIRRKASKSFYHQNGTRTVKLRRKDYCRNAV